MPTRENPTGSNSIVRAPLSDDDPFDTRVGYLVRRLHHAHIAMFTAAFEEFKLTPIQWGVMVVVASGDGMPLASIAARCAADRVTIGDVIRRLEDRGIVRQAQDLVDKRQRLTFITAYGRDLIESLSNRVEDVQSSLLRPLSRSERAEFLRLLQKLLASPT